MSYFSNNEKDKQVINFLVEDRFRIHRHLFFAIGLLVLFCVSFWNDYTAKYDRFSRIFVIYVIFLAMFYVNMYVLVPLLFFKAKYLLYLLSLVAVVLIGINMLSFIFNHFFDIADEIKKQSRPIRNTYYGIMISIPIIMVATTVKLLQRWVKDSQRISNLKNLTLNMELNELKNQINPHFLFNMLNNVKALIRTDPERANTVIMKLSDFLRYQLYENNEQKTPLNSEINFISNFLNLEKVRRDNFRFEISCEIEENRLKNVFIPPNLFTTFIENAVKHGVNISDEEAFISINIKIEDKMLFLTCVNSKEFKNKKSEKYSGLGLANIKRRLELLYGATFLLEINSHKHIFEVKLIIPT